MSNAKGQSYLTDVEKEYQELMKSRAMLEAAQRSGAVVDKSGPMQPGVGEEAIRKARPQEAIAEVEPMENPSQGAEDSDIEDVGDLTTSAGLASKSPYLAGAGIALKGIGMVDNAKRKDEQSQIDAYNNALLARRQTYRNMFG